MAGPRCHKSQHLADSVSAGSPLEKLSQPGPNREVFSGGEIRDLQGVCYCFSLAEEERRGKERKTPGGVWRPRVAIPTVSTVIGHGRDGWRCNKDGPEVTHHRRCCTLVPLLAQTRQKP